MDLIYTTVLISSVVNLCCIAYVLGKMGTKDKSH